MPKGDMPDVERVAGSPVRGSSFVSVGPDTVGPVRAEGDSGCIGDADEDGVLQECYCERGWGCSGQFRAGDDDDHD